MGLETGSYVADLTITNPLSNDPKSQGDDHLRLIKTVLKNTFAGYPGLVVTVGTEAQGATVNDYVVTVSPAPAAYTSNFFVAFKSTHANTGAVTLAINALTAKTLKAVDGSALESGDIESGGAVVAFYDGTNFFLISGNDRSARAGDTYTGTHDFSGATAITAPTKSQGDNSTNAATTAYVDTGLSLKATIASPTFTGDPKAPTPAAGDNDTSLATTAFAMNMQSPAFIGTPTVPTATPGTNTTQIASTAFVIQQAFQTALPAQGGNAGKYLKTDGTTASWEFSGITGYAAKTSAYTIVAADKERLIDCTSGTFTLSLTAASTLSSSWGGYVRNSGSGTITIDPNGAETIDALTTLTMYPGETRLIFSDGTNFFSLLLSGGSHIVTSTGAFIVPTGISWLLVDAFGGGGGGGGGRGSAAGTARPGGSGGGGGSHARLIMQGSQIPTAGSSITGTIGAGGAGGSGGVSANGSNGTVGGDTAFGSLLTAFGGGAGAGGTSGSNISGGAGGGIGSSGADGSTAIAKGGKPRGASYGSGDNLTGATESTFDTVGGGGAASATTGASANAEYGGGSGGNSAGDGSGGNNAGGSIYGAGGGGGSGGITAANAVSDGGSGGKSGGYSTSGGGAGGTAGAAGTAGANGTNGIGGKGGGGGGGSASTTGGAGGAGGASGGGGGGGGGGTSTGGAGGAGGRGEIRITWG